MNISFRKYALIIIAMILACGFTWRVLDDKKKKYITVQEALERNLLESEVFGKGGYRGYVISLAVTNLAGFDSVFCLEPGRRLKSDDSTTQDILIVKEQIFALKAGEKKIIDGFGFCCQAGNHSPGAGEKFTIGNMADKKLVDLAKHLNEHEYPIDAMQGAVWVISDGKPLSCIHDADTSKVEKVRELQKFVAKLAGINVNFAWYSIKFREDTTQLFSGVPDSLFGEIRYDLWKNCAASMVMYDSLGAVLQRFFVNKPHGPNQYLFPVKLDVYGWPKGKYYIRLFADGQMKEEKIFVL
ncbi:MAG: hypothetical protein ABIJ16_06670 [Bacteroidota bacterium]